MRPNQFSRAALASITGGLVWVISGLLAGLPIFVDQYSVLHSSPTAVLVQILLPAASLLLAIGLVALRQLYAGLRAIAGRSGLAMCLIGLLTISVASVAGERPSLDVLSDALGVGGLPIGITLFSVGLIVVGSATMQSRQRTGWQALPLLLGLIGLFLPVGAAVRGLPGLVVWVVFGLGWIWMGVIMSLEHAPKADHLEAMTVRK